MRLLNTKSPEDVAKIFPWLVPTETETRMDIATELYGRLKEKPEDTFVLVAIERNITRAILIARITKRRTKRIVLLLQAQAEDGFKYGKLMLECLKNWSMTNRAKEIKCNSSINFPGIKEGRML